MAPHRGKERHAAALASKKGSQAVVPYSGEGANKTAHAVKVVGDQSVKSTKGTVTAVDQGAGTVTVKATDGTEHTFHKASDGVVEAGKATKTGTKSASEKTAQAATTGSQVTVHYTVDGGKKVAHGIAHVF